MKKYAVGLVLLLAGCAAVVNEEYLAVERDLYKASVEARVGCAQKLPGSWICTVVGMKITGARIDLEDAKNSGDFTAVRKSIKDLEVWAK